MSVVWHSSLTTGEVKKIANIQKTCLKLIMGEDYEDYPSSLEKTQLKELSARRKARCLSFARKSLTSPLVGKLFPENPLNLQGVKRHEKYKVNFAHTENYRHSSVPYCQRLLNKHDMMEEEKRRTRREEAGAREKEEARAREREEARARERGEGARHWEREEAGGARRQQGL